MLKISLIREGKKPVDRRVAFSPDQARELVETYPNLQLSVQSSTVRCFTDEEYREQGIRVTEEAQASDMLIGIKEVPVEELFANKTYLFFSHTIKKQPYNRFLLQEILRKKIRLIDYERLTDENGHRLVAFGRWAGIVGAYNALWTWGRRMNSFNLRRAFQCYDYEDLKKEFKKVKLPTIKIALTGSGRVAKGAMEVLDGAGIRKVSPKEYLQQTFDEPVYTQLSSRHYHVRRSDGKYDAQDFHQNPEKYDAYFTPFLKKTDLLIAAAYWNPEAPVLFTKADMLEPEFRIKVIADITCDIEGSVPSTIKASSIEDPIYDYDPQTHTTQTPLSSDKNITVMAIDNLPCELPRDASEEFGRLLLKHVVPSLAGKAGDCVLKRATITENGRLMPEYSYLQEYVEGME